MLLENEHIELTSCPIQIYHWDIFHHFPPTLHAWHHETKWTTFGLQGFDEYMNLVLDDAEEIHSKTKSRKQLGEYSLYDR